MTAPSFTYSGNVYTGAAAGTVDFALTSTTGNAIAYLEPSHIHVYKSSNQGSTWTELTRPSQWDFVTNGTVARLVTGIAAGDWVKVQRITPSTSSYVTFQASSLLTADQLNDDTLFNTYLNQERVDQSDQSTLTANTASTNAATAVSTANTALSTANAASASAASAVSTANTASTNATAAVATANTASTNASAAVATANTASSNASAAVSTANTAASNASTALSTANTALTNANAAVTTSNNANTTAQAANTTATNAESIANSALSIVAGTVQFVPVANVAAIPASPSNDDAIQIQDSTGIQSFTPLTGLPSGFVGTPQLFVRLQYDTPGSTWQYVGYGANDPDNRYVIQGVTGTANNPSFYFDPDTGIYSPGANELGLSTGGAARLTIDSAGAVAIPGSLSVAGQAAVVTNDARLSDTRTPTDNTVNTAKIVDGAVTSAKIADDTIVNADVNASAAIAGTKISPDFGSQNVTTTGTSTAASFIPASSTVPTNGVYLPAANSVAISTNSTGRLFIDSSGRVGVGTNSPSQLLSLSSGAGPRLSITDTRASVDMQVLADNVAGYAGTTTNYPLIFVTNNSERLRITSAGLVGIGTSAPSTPLHVNSLSSSAGINTVATFATPQNANTTSGGAILLGGFYGDGNGSRISATGNPQLSGAHDLWLQTRTTSGALTNGLFIDTTGRVGIGTTSANVRLHVNVDSASETDVARFQASNGADVQFLDIGVDPTGNLVSYDATGSTGGAHVFRRGGSEVMRLDDSSRLLVGTSSASATGHKVEIDNGSSPYGLLCYTSGDSQESSFRTYRNSSGTSGLKLEFARGTKASPLVVQNGDRLGYLGYVGYDGTNYQTAASIDAYVDGTPGANDMPGRLVFSVTQDGSASPTEAMRITNAREVCIGTTAAHVANRNALENATTGQLTFRHSGATAGRYNIVGMTVGSAFVVADATGLTGVQLAYSGTSWSTLSDERHKTDLMPIDDGLAKVGSLRAVTGRLVTDPESKSRSFLIAQDVQAVLPQAVDTTDPDALALSYTEVIPLLVAALKESKERIETLEAKVAALESA